MGAVPSSRIFVAKLALGFSLYSVLKVTSYYPDGELNWAESAATP